jgi:hypothetical protein
MVPHPDGTWTERVDGSEPEPSDLYCCYNCSEQLAPSVIPSADPGDYDDSDDFEPAGEFTIYLLLLNERVVYVGKDKRLPARLSDHSKKQGWVFNDMIETGEWYSDPEARRREKLLIQWYGPFKNKQHKPLVPKYCIYNSKALVRDFWRSEDDYLMFLDVEAQRLERRVLVERVPQLRGQ